MAGVNVRIYRPKNSYTKENSIMVFFHGGNLNIIKQNFKKTYK
jgi:acetyl esterase/lipase